MYKKTAKNLIHGINLYIIVMHIKGGVILLRKTIGVIYEIVIIIG